MSNNKGQWLRVGINDISWGCYSCYSTRNPKNFGINGRMHHTLVHAVCLCVLHARLMTRMDQNGVLHLVDSKAYHIQAYAVISYFLLQVTPIIR